MRKVIISDEKIVTRVLYEYKTGKSIRTVAKILGVGKTTISNILKRNEIVGRDKHSCYGKKFNKYYFDIIDTQEKAYFLGLLYADGSVRKRKGKDSWRVSLALAADDRYLVERFKEELNSEHKISVYKYKDKNWQEMYKLEISNKYFANQLMEKGVLTNKTHVLYFPDFLEDAFKPHFVRGFFDGDGCICERNNCNNKKKLFRVTMVGNIYFLSGLKVYLNTNNIKCSIYKDRSVHVLVCGGQGNILMFSKLIYKDVGIKMKRKYKKFLELKKQFEDCLS